MPFTVAIKYDGRRLNKLARDMGYVSGRQFLQRTSFTNERNQLLKFIKRITPRSEAKSNRKEFGTSLANAWRITISKRDFTVQLRVRNLIEEASTRGRIVYQSIQFGSKSYSFILKRNIMFLDMRRNRTGKKVFLRAGYEMFRGERAGIQQPVRIKQYVDTVFAAGVQRKVRQKLSEALSLVSVVRQR